VYTCRHDSPACSDDEHDDDDFDEMDMFGNLKDELRLVWLLGNSDMG
jgi:hypothetical protein